MAGPVLYNAYPSTLEKVVSPPINLYGFADDHTIKHSFKPIPDEECEVIHTPEHSAPVILKTGWMQICYI